LHRSAHFIFILRPVPSIDPEKKEQLKQGLAKLEVIKENAKNKPTAKEQQYEHFDKLNDAGQVVAVGITEKLTEMSLFQSGVYVEPSKFTVGQWLDIWHKEYLGNVQEGTSAAYEKDIRVHPQAQPWLCQTANTEPEPSYNTGGYNKLGRSVNKQKALSAKSIHNLNGTLHAGGGLLYVNVDLLIMEGVRGCWCRGEKGRLANL